MQFISHKEGIEDELSLLNMAAFPVGQGWKAKDFKELLEISFHHILVNYDLENKIRGFLLYSVILDEAEILTFSVNPDDQRKNIGARIMTEFLEQMRKDYVKTVFLEVAEDNLPALNLYNKFGFSLNGRRAKYYNNQIDALLMVKII